MLSAKVSDPDWERETRNKTFDRLETSRDKGFAFFVHQELGLTFGELQSVYMELMTSVQKQNLTLVVKLHPRYKEARQEWANWANEIDSSSEAILFLSDECTSFDLCVACDLCIAVYSTVVIEALICRKPVVLLKYVNVPWQLPYGEKYQVFEQVSEVSQLDAAIAKALDSAEQEDTQRQIDYFLSQELCGLDGKSVQRMRDLIVERSRN